MLRPPKHADYNDAYFAEEKIMRLDQLTRLSTALAKIPMIKGESPEWGNHTVALYASGREL